MGSGSPRCYVIHSYILSATHVKARKIVSCSPLKISIIVTNIECKNNKNTQWSPNGKKWDIAASIGCPGWSSAVTKKTTKKTIGNTWFHCYKLSCFLQDQGSLLTLIHIAQETHIIGVHCSRTKLRYSSNHIQGVKVWNTICDKIRLLQTCWF